MGTLIGFVIGYLLGLTDGQNGSAAKTMAAWRKIRSSEEFRALISGGSAILVQTLRHYMAQINASGNQGQPNVLGLVLKQGVHLLMNDASKRR